MTSPVESSDTQSEHPMDGFLNAQTTQSSNVGDAQSLRLATNAGRLIEASSGMNLPPITTALEESGSASSHISEMNTRRRFDLKQPSGDQFLPPVDAWSSQQGFIDPIRKMQLQMARQNAKNFTEDEEVVDAISIIRNSMNRMMRKEAGLHTHSPPEVTNDPNVPPLTLVSLQRRHLFANRSALGEILDVMKGIQYPDAHFDQANSDAHEFGTGYMSLDKFGVICDWVRNVERLREQGLLEGEIVPEADLVWSFDDDYGKSLMHIDICS